MSLLLFGGANVGIRDSLYFTYNGKTSDEMGLINVNVGSNNSFEESFLPNRKIIEQTIRGNPSPYFIDVQYEPLVVPVSFAFLDYYDSDSIRSVARWLLTDYYAPLSFSDNYDRIFYAMVVDDSKLIHNGLKEGYLQLSFRCNSPYAFTPVYESSIYDYSSNTVGGTDYTFVNVGDLACKPTITIQIISGGTFTITNNSNSGQKLSFTGLSDNETLTIDCEAETIETDIPATYRYGNMSSDSEFLSMLYGNNYLNIKGNVKIQWKWQSPLLQG